MFTLLLAIAATVPLGQPSCDTKIIHSGNNSIYAWQQDLVGTACRTWGRRAGWVQVDVDIESGGYDCGVATSELPERIRHVFGASPLQAKLTVKLRGEGHWWAGAKFCVCKTEKWQGLPGNFECYVIESAEMPREELMKVMQATLRGKSTVDGDVYFHYTKPWEQWHQYIAIRETYRDEGAIHFATILRHWHETLDLPDWYCHSPKVGLETTGENRGMFRWDGIVTSKIHR